MTAANASGLNDGAAALVLMMSPTQGEAQRGLKPLGAHQEFLRPMPGLEPEIMGTGPVPASQQVRSKKAGWSVAKDLDLDRKQRGLRRAVAVRRATRSWVWDPAKVNVNGGAIAIGHPIGASGARILDDPGSRDEAVAGPRSGLATLCVGGGMGVALCDRGGLDGLGGKTSDPVASRLALAAGSPAPIGLAPQENASGETDDQSSVLVTGGTRGIGRDDLRAARSPMPATRLPSWLTRPATRSTPPMACRQT